MYSLKHTCCFSPVLFRCRFCPQDGNTEKISTPWWQSLANLGFRNHLFDVINKNSGEKVSNPTKVCLITNYWLVLKTNISSRLYSHLYSSRNVFPCKVSREEHERNRRKKLTQPKQKKIVTRKLSNKVSQVLKDFLCTDKPTYMLEGGHFKQGAVAIVLISSDHFFMSCHVECVRFSR